jgi:hypothetical protein
MLGTRRTLRHADPSRQSSSDQKRLIMIPDHATGVQGGIYRMVIPLVAAALSLSAL